MTNLRVLCLVAALTIPSQLRAQPQALLTASLETQSCRRDLICIAVESANTLTAQPREVRGPALTFEPSSARVYSVDRERIQALAAAWQAHANWAVITIEGYPDAWMRSEPRKRALAEQRAERIRGYLIRYGVDPAYVTAIGHGDTAHKGAGSRVELTITLCDRATQTCLQ